jgi:DsbC/DsbD-like thiol-disulfide interchange protein
VAHGAQALQTIAGLSFLFASAAPGHAAADASPWDGNERSAVRLIAGSTGDAAGESTLRAGIEIRLGSGWKTYWRYPGDSGVPPDVEFAGSENVERVDIRWPAPIIFAEADTRSIGYTDDVVLPLRVVPRDPAKPALLALQIKYAICEKLCVPADGKVELKLPISQSSHESALRASERRVPALVKLGERQGLAITAMRREQGPAHPRVVVDVQAQEPAQVELLAEGPTPEWSLPVPTAIAVNHPGLHRFAFDLDGLPAGAKPDGAVLRLTAVSGNDAIEVDARLD